jgi:hypothetical protein
MVCGKCGQLAWPADVGGAHPHREDVTSMALRLQQCSFCGADEWIDLRYEATALALRENEAVRRPSLALRRASLLLTAVFGVGVGAAAGLVAAIPWWGTTLLAAHLGALAGLLWKRAHAPFPARRSERPIRWAMALLPAGSSTEQIRGTVELCDEALRSPISGRRCAAFEVGVRDDEQADARPDTWRLLEQHLALVEVADQQVDQDSTHLELRRQFLGTIGSMDLDEAALVYLRQRGFYPGDHGLCVFETIVEPGAEVEVIRFEDGNVLRPLGS